MWILILTLLTNTGAALTTAEFDTKKACIEAGSTWNKDMNKKLGVSASYRCVSKANLLPNHIYNK